MFKFRYQIKRLRNMWLEFIRLVLLYTTPDTSGRGHRWHLVFDWQSNSTVWDPIRGLFGREYRIAEYMHLGDKYPRYMRDDDGQEVRIRRDFFDQVVDTVGGVIGLFWKNIFQVETCTHPHQKVWVNWEGDRECGFAKQHNCGRCGSYISTDDIDQYLPPEDRHPELIEGFGKYPKGHYMLDEVSEPAEDEGSCYSDDEDRTSFALHGTEVEYEANRQALRDSFSENSDVYFGMTLDQYQAKLVELGFEEVLKDDFTHSHCGRERPDSYYIYAHRDGFLITFDTYTSDYGVEEGFGKTSLNSADLHYNWQPNGDLHRIGPLTSSGGYVQYPDEGDTNTPAIWGGYHDAREGVSYAMRGLREHGKILNPWFKNHINWLASQSSVQEKDHSTAHGAETRAEWNRWYNDMMDRSEKNYDALPEWVRTMIGPIVRTPRQ